MIKTDALKHKWDNANAADALELAAKCGVSVSDLIPAFLAIFDHVYRQRPPADLLLDTQVKRAALVLGGYPKTYTTAELRNSTMYLYSKLVGRGSLLETHQGKLGISLCKFSDYIEYLNGGQLIHVVVNTAVQYLAIASVYATCQSQSPYQMGRSRLTKLDFYSQVVRSNISWSTVEKSIANTATFTQVTSTP